MGEPMPDKPLHVGSGSTPVPDPTERTIQALVREMGSLREVLESQINGHREVLEARIDGMDKAIRLLQTISDRVPSDVDSKVAHLRVLHEEKFRSIDVQFHERDIRVEQRATDTKTAVEAAFAANKELARLSADSFGLSIGKSEAATMKQIDQLGITIQQSTKATDDKIGDIKERLTRIEGAGVGQKEAVVTRQSANTNTMGIIGLATGILFGLGGLVVAIMSRMP